MSEGRRRISTIYSILCKWRVEGSPEEEVKRKGGRRREGKGKTEGKVERVIRASVDRSFFHLRILISRWKKRERANETIRRGRRKRRNPIYKMSLSLSLSLTFFLELCLDTQGQRSSLPFLVSSRKNGARTTSPTGCPVPFLHHRSKDSKRYERNGSLVVSRVGRLYLLDLTRFFDNQGEEARLRNLRNISLLSFESLSLLYCVSPGCI